MSIKLRGPAPYRPATVIHPPRPVYVRTEPDFAPAVLAVVAWIAFFTVLFAAALYAFDAPQTWTYPRPQ